MACLFDPVVDQAVARLQSHYIYTFMDLHSNQQTDIIVLMHRLFYYMARHRLGRIADCPQFWGLLKAYYPERLSDIKSKLLPSQRGPMTPGITTEQHQLLYEIRNMTVTVCLLASRHRLFHADTYRFMQLYLLITKGFFD